MSGTTLTGYGGVGEIGGNAFLLEHDGHGLFLDFGKRFGSDPKTDERVPGWNDYYDSFLQPRGHRLVDDLSLLGIIPDIPSLYRQDRGGKAGVAPVDGVLVSHAHMDHCGLLGLLRPDVPVLTSAGSKATLDSLSVTGSGVMSEYFSLRPKGILPKKDGNPGKGSQWSDEDGPVTAERDVIVDDGALGSWNIRHFDVDHSIHGARASIIEGPQTIVYTGDFRMHGRDADATKKFVERAGGADVIICEGTRVSRSHDHAHNNTDDEHAVEGEIEGLLDSAGDDFVGVSFPPRDLDRFLSIWHVARSSGRRVVIPTKLAHLIDQVRPTEPSLPDPKRDPNVAIHVPVRGKGVLKMPRGKLLMTTRDLDLEPLEVDDETWTDFWLSDHDTWERPFLLCDNTVTSAEVAKDPHSYLFSISYWSISELFDVFPTGVEGGLYVHSMTQPFNDEMEISDRKLRRWLDAFGLERHDTHVSGHLSEDDLHWVLDEIGAKTLVPVHSEAPDITAEKFEHRTGHRALIPDWGRQLDLG